MTDRSLRSFNSERDLDYHIMALLERLEAMKRNARGNAFASNRRKAGRGLQDEFKSLEIWRACVCECIASFFYIFITCGAATSTGIGASISSVLLATSLAAGLTMTTLTHCFMNVSGAHVNPAVTLAACITRVITPLRAAVYVGAQCGGGIAGAALLYGVTVPGYQGNLQAIVLHSAALTAWERFGIEFLLTFIVVFVYFNTMNSSSKYLGSPAIFIGAAYAACSFVSMPYLNPVRSFGPSFILRKWDNHWIYWLGPMAGGVLSGVIYKYIFTSHRNMEICRLSRESDSGSSSMHSAEDSSYDLDVEKAKASGGDKFSGTLLRKLQPTPETKSAMNEAAAAAAGNYIQNLYVRSPQMSKADHLEPLYSGTHSLYSGSPLMSRVNLNRSQSVYAKHNGDLLTRTTPLTPNFHAASMQQPQNQQVIAFRASPFQQMSQQQPITRAYLQPQHVQQQQQQHHHQQQQQQQHQQQLLQTIQQDYKPAYATIRSPHMTEHSTHHRYENSAASAYGLTIPRHRIYSAKSDDSSYSSYQGSAISPSPRIIKDDSLRMFPLPIDIDGHKPGDTGSQPTPTIAVSSAPTPPSSLSETANASAAGGEAHGQNHGQNQGQNHGQNQSQSPPPPPSQFRQ